MFELLSYDDIQVGDRVSLRKTITEADQAMYSAAIGGFGPVHNDDGYASQTRFGERIASGIMIAGMCTSILTSHLVGVAPVSIEDRFRFVGAVRFGDTLTVEVWVEAKDPARRTLDWRASVRNQDGVEVVQANATMKYPRALMPASA